MSDFDVSIQQLGGSCRVAIIGELDIVTAPIFRKLLADVYGSVIVDCRDLTFLDSSGMTELVLLANRVVSVVLSNPPHVVKRVIEATGLGGLLQIAE